MSEAIITIDENGKPVTPNYGLIKPTGEDFYDIEDHNTNMDTIDTALKSQSESIHSQGEVIKILEEEIEGLEFTWDSIQNKPTLFPPSSHTHDDRYYTETEANSRFAPSSHTHTGLQGTNQPLEIQEWIDFHKTGSSKDYDVRLNINHSTGGLDINSAIGANGSLYHTGMKPTKEDVGLGNVPNYGASTSVSSTSTTTLATSSAVRTAYNKGVEALNKANQAFQSADSGKKALATAITAKGVSASATDTFATLSNKVGQIAVAKKVKDMTYSIYRGLEPNIPCEVIEINSSAKTMTVDCYLWAVSYGAYTSFTCTTTAYVYKGNYDKRIYAIPPNTRTDISYDSIILTPFGGNITWQYSTSGSNEVAKSFKYA